MDPSSMNSETAAATTGPTIERPEIGRAGQTVVLRLPGTHKRVQGAMATRPYRADATADGVVRMRRDRVPLWLEDGANGNGRLVALAGLTAPVLTLLAAAGVDAGRLPLARIDLPLPTDVQDKPAGEAELVRFVAARDRGLIHYRPDHIDPADLLARLHKAWPEQSIVAFARTRDEVVRVADRLRRLGVDAVGVTGRSAPHVRKPVVLNSLAKSHAAVAAGDPDAVAVQDLLDECGPEAPRNPVPNGETHPRQVQAVGTLARMLGTYSRNQIKFALTAIPEAYGDAKGQMRGQMIVALAEFAKARPDFDRKRVMAVLTDLDPDHLAEDARAYKGIKGGTTVQGMVEALERVYEGAGRKGTA